MINFLTPYQTSKPLKIGLFGGSFNPAHEGHLKASLKALRTVGLDEIWWLVSPQNPLKSADELQNHEKRVTAARALTASHPKIIVTDLEKQLNTQYSYDTVFYLKKHLPQQKFIWICGADSFLEMPKWHRWDEFIRMIPFYILSRPPHTRKIEHAHIAQKYMKYKVDSQNLKKLIHLGGKYWGYDKNFHIPLSSTKLRHQMTKV